MICECQHVCMSISLSALSECQPVTLSACQVIIVSVCHCGSMSLWHHLSMLVCQSVSLSACHCISTSVFIYLFSFANSWQGHRQATWANYCGPITDPSPHTHEQVDHTNQDLPPTLTEQWRGWGLLRPKITGVSVSRSVCQSVGVSQCVSVSAYQ